MSVVSRKNSKIVSAFKLVILLIALIAMVAMFFIATTLLGFVEDVAKSALERVVPGLYYYSIIADTEADIVKATMGSLVGADYPKAVLDSQFSYIAFGSEKKIDSEPEPESLNKDNEEVLVLKDEYEEETTYEEPESESTGDDKPLVAIYNSHNGETYTPTHGSPRVDGEQGGVVDVAQELQRILADEYGIKSVRSEEMHDYPSYAMSYANSQKTVERILEENPSVEVVLDIHRDYQPTRAQSVASVNGEEAARMLLVVGNDSRQPHPNWRQNLAFATGLEKKLEEKYPGISRGVRQQNGRYNQHLHPRAILVEMGTAENSLEEAKRSAGYLAEALADFMNEINEGHI